MRSSRPSSFAKAPRHTRRQGFELLGCTKPAGLHGGTFRADEHQEQMSLEFVVIISDLAHTQLRCEGM